MSNFLDWMAEIGNLALPVFVFFTMFNVGLSQNLKDITGYLKEWKFLLRVVLANFIGGPLVMYLLIQLFSLSTPMAVGLMIFSMCAGAPFMIKLTKFSDNDVALGTSLMLVLVLVSCLYVPIVLPMILSDVSVSGWELFVNLTRQLVLPIVIGQVLDALASNFSKTIQPWAAKIGNLALWVIIIGTLVGNIEGLMGLVGNGAMLAGVLFIVTVTILGYYIVGKKKDDHFNEIGAFGTGQRNTAASMLIAANNFPDNPEIFLIITVVNMLGMIIHLGVAKYVSGELLSSLRGN